VVSPRMPALRPPGAPRPPRGVPQARGLGLGCGMREWCGGWHILRGPCVTSRHFSGTSNRVWLSGAVCCSSLQVHAQRRMLPQ
jgi:hypothetical protein